MKKVLAIALLGVFVLSSCKKEVACDCGGIISTYTKLNKKDRETHKTNCETIGCKQVTK